MSGTETKVEPISIGGGLAITPEQPPIPASEPNKIIIELSNLGSGSMRTVKRELKVLIEDYAWKKLISGSVKVTEGE